MCTGVQEYLGLSRVPHYTTLQKAAARLEQTILHRMLIEFVLYKKVRLVLAGIDGGLDSAIRYCIILLHKTSPVAQEKILQDGVLCADMNSQLICAAAIHHSFEHDNLDFLPLLKQTSRIIPVGIVLGDMGFDDEKNHAAGARNVGAAAVIPTRHADAPICRTGGNHRREMKKNFPEQLYHQRNKSETIFFFCNQTNDVWQHYIKKQHNTD